MITPLRKLVLVGITIGLISCQPGEVTDALTAIASYPRVCLSDIKMVRANDRVAFFPVVHNVGANNSNTAFNLRQVARLDDEFVIEAQFAVPGTVDIIGTGGSATSSAGPLFSVDQQYLKLPIGSPTGPKNDPNAVFVAYVADKFYRVDAELSSPDENFSIASRGCTLITRYFRNGERL